MSITTTTHLNFRGQGKAALDFYQFVFGGQVAAITFADAHNVQREGGLATAEEADQIMWGQVQGDNGFHVMVYDVPSALSYDRGDKPVYVSVRGDADAAAEVTGYWKGLTDGATIQAELAPAPWGASLYGNVDRQVRGRLGRGHRGRLLTYGTRGGARCGAPSASVTARVPLGRGPSRTRRRSGIGETGGDTQPMR